MGLRRSCCSCSATASASGSSRADGLTEFPIGPLATGPIALRPLTAADIPAADALLHDAFGGRIQARRGELVDVLEGGMGVLALDRTGALVGIVTWAIDAGDAAVDAGGRAAEIRAVAVAAGARGLGIGRALPDEAAVALRAAGVRRAWLITTNDNLAAIALYQKAGWLLSALRAGAVDELRRTIKPWIPEVGQLGIPLRDELELTIDL